MYTGTDIMVLGIVDYFFRLDSIREIIGPNIGFETFVQISKSLFKKVKDK